MSVFALERSTFLVTWLKFQMNFKHRQEKSSHLLEKLHSIEYKLRNHRHPLTRQQYHDHKHQMKMIADDLHHLDKQIQHVNIPSTICLTPLSAGSSGYGSDMNSI